jgi:hypothetical protein
MRFRICRICLTAVLGILVTVSILPVSQRGRLIALPNFAMEYGQSCSMCHVDPAGGGARNLYGSQIFARTMLPTSPDGFEELQNVNPQINKWVTLGADFRILHSDVENSPVNLDQIMEGSIYLTAQLHPKYTLNISKGWNIDYQAFGLAQILPLDGYLKVGRFLPNFGLRFDDHTLYTRDGLFGFPTYSDVGVEFGFRRRKWEFSAAVSNGTSLTANDNKAYAFTARTVYGLKLHGMDVMIGGSAYGDEYIGGDNEQFWYGPFYGFHIGQLTFLGEVDFTRDLPASIASGSPTDNPTGVVSSQLLYYEMFRGFWLRGGYDFQDYDIDWKTGSRERYTAGAEWFPYGFLELLLNFRLQRTTNASGVTSDANEVDAQVHLFF